jgi:hypothetical protein
MGWKGVTVMDQRVRFIAEYLKGYFPFNELYGEFNISRKTGYKWVERYEQGGPGGVLPFILALTIENQERGKGLCFYRNGDHPDNSY